MNDTKQTEREAYHAGYQAGYENGKRDAVKWISVKERLPNIGEDVLVLVGADMFVMALARKDQETADIEWVDAQGYIAEMWEVTHWMQLPPPPEGGQDD